MPPSVCAPCSPRWAPCRSQPGPRQPQGLLGEWASQEGRPTPDLTAALGDASWLTDLIRNSDQVLMESYAPLFSNVNNNAWATNLIAYDALTSYNSPSYNSPSYCAQQLLRTQQGDVVVPTTVRALPGLSVVTTRSTRTGRIYLAVVNTGGTARTSSVTVAGAGAVAGSGRVTLLAGAPPAATSTLDHPTRGRRDLGGRAGPRFRLARGPPRYARMAGSSPNGPSGPGPPR